MMEQDKALPHKKRRFPSYKTIPGDNCNGVGEVSLLSLEDMVHLAIETIPAARHALAMQLNSGFEGICGKRVKRDAQPLLARLNLAEAVLPHFGATDEERRDNLKRLQVEQIEGGENHGMFVARRSSRSSGQTSGKTAQLAQTSAVQMCRSCGSWTASRLLCRMASGSDHR